MRAWSYQEGGGGDGGGGVTVKASYLKMYSNGIYLLKGPCQSWMFFSFFCLMVGLKDTVMQSMAYFCLFLFNQNNEVDQ